LEAISLFRSDVYIARLAPELSKSVLDNIVGLAVKSFSMLDLLDPVADVIVCPVDLIGFLAAATGVSPVARSIELLSSGVCVLIWLILGRFVSDNRHVVVAYVLVAGTGVLAVACTKHTRLVEPELVTVSLDDGREWALLHFGGDVLHCGGIVDSSDVLVLLEVVDDLWLSLFLILARSSNTLVFVLIFGEHAPTMSIYPRVEDSTSIALEVEVRSIVFIVVGAVKDLLSREIQWSGVSGDGDLCRKNGVRGDCIASSAAHHILNWWDFAKSEPVDLFVNCFIAKLSPAIIFFPFTFTFLIINSRIVVSGLEAHVSSSEVAGWWKASEKCASLTWSQVRESVVTKLNCIRVT